MAIQWGLAQGPNAFENAFAQGAQVGQAIRQQRTQNALADYVGSQPQGDLVATPEQQAQSDKAWQTLVRSNPQLAMQIRQQEMQQETMRRREIAAGRKEQMDSIPVTLNMLNAAKSNPQAYPQIRAQAIQLGVPGADKAPEAFDPAWIDQQLTILQAFDQDGGKAITEAGKYAREYGLTPEDPRYQDFITTFLNEKFAQPYTGSQGETRVRYPNFAGPNQRPQSGPQPGAIEDGYRFKGGNPADPNSWEPVQGGPTPPASGNFPQ